MTNYIATEEDRKHFCTRDEAMAAIPDELLFLSNGFTHVALNVTTGHRIPCADAYMAAGYVAGSAVLMPQYKFVLEMGSMQVRVAAHHHFKRRLNQSNWPEIEAQEEEEKRKQILLEIHARQAYNNVLLHGVPEEEY